MAVQKSKEKAQYEPPASQVDLARRLESGNASNAVLPTSDVYDENAKALSGEGGEEGDEGRVFAVEGNDLDDYVGTDPIYQTYANETEKPSRAEGDDNPEAQLEEAEFGQLPVKAWDMPEVDDDDENDSSPSEPTPPPAPSN